MMKQAKRLLLTLDQVTHSGPTEKVTLLVLHSWKKMPHLGIALHAATLLAAQSYITLERSNIPEDARLQITPAGVAEAARLRLPFWKRWLTDKDLVGKLAAAVVGGIVTVVGMNAFRLLWP